MSRLSELLQDDNFTGPIATLVLVAGCIAIIVLTCLGVGAGL